MAESGPTRAPLSFEDELATYAAHREALLASAEGKFVVVRGSELIGPYQDYKSAYSGGLATFGEAPMLI